MIAIIDYGIGNLGSIQNMIKRMGGKSVITAKPEEIQSAAKLLLPGVGAFDNGMNHLKETGLIDLLNKRVLDEKVPVIGICLGMQLLMESSEEGKEPGLGWVKGKVKKFKFDAGSNLKIPHMGWNLVEPQKQTPLSANLYEESRFYFVHSYYVDCANREDVMFTTKYGIEFTSGLQHGNIYGAQFHPEKSHKFGMRLFENFIKL